MHVTTTRFGTVEVPDESLVTFADGLPGFPGRRRMALLGSGGLGSGGGDAAGGSPHHDLYWLQDADDPDLAFLTIVPWAAFPDYDIEIDPAEVGGPEPDDVCVLNIVTVRREGGGVQMTANLLAPIVIDTAARTGRQLILADADLPLHAPLEAPLAPDDGRRAAC